MTDEIWKEIPGYRYYEASSLGRIRSMPRGRRKGKVLKPRPGNGYLRVNLSIDGEHLTAGIHRLVCLAFHGLPASGDLEAAHGDGVKTNNANDNLRWATPLENQQDKILHGNSLKGEKCPTAKLNWDIVRSIRKSNEPTMAIAKRHGVNYSFVYKIRAHESWVEPSCTSQDNSSREAA